MPNSVTCMNVRDVYALTDGDDYQEQIAEAIYNGLRNYFMQHPLQSAPRGEAAQTASAAAPGGMLIN